MLNLALIVGLLLSTTSLLELFLLPYQRKLIEEFMEELVIHAEYTEPIAFRTKLKEPSIQLLFLFFTLFYTAALALFQVLARTLQGWITPASTPTAVTFPPLFILAAIIFTIYVIYKGCKYSLPKFFIWILKSNRSLQQVVTFVLISLCYFVAIILYAGIALFFAMFAADMLRLLGFTDNRLESSLWLWANLPLCPALGLWTIAFNGVLIASYPNNRLVQLLFKIFRGTLWRLAFYNKGAVSAGILLITAILGVMKIVVS